MMGTSASRHHDDDDDDIWMEGNARFTFINPGHRRLAYRVPRELIERTALFLADATSFFHFLLAFSVSIDALGDLQFLLALGRQLPLDDLWPRLQLHRLNMPLVVPYLSAISKYYPVIDVHDCRAICDDTCIEHLATLPLSKTTTFHLLQSSTMWWPPSWNQHLPITSVVMTMNSSPLFVHELSTMPYLTDLTLHLQNQMVPACLDAIFASLPTSKLMSLEIVASFPVPLTESMAASVVQWLETKCVRRLTCAVLDLSAVPDWEMRFFAAVASCSSLTSLRLSELTLERVATAIGGRADHLELDLRAANPLMVESLIATGCDNLRSLIVRDPNFRSFAWGARLHEILAMAPALEKVELFGVALDDASIDSFGAALAASNISWLTLRHYNWDVDEWTVPELHVALHRFGQWLPRCRQLRRLELSCITRDKVEIDALGEGLVESSVTEFIATSITSRPPSCFKWRHLSGGRRFNI
ncbi:Aste57867_2527 [Aphanomyces stellatus]|uniref:Aste57867_2527 protein n=1 Tax=Aphanomyces stellatus TaxID=120398 RepID=A0A485KC11_9STRA|nr:hypothetical protein As57867_002520 [Aphanomyces stellatus]VFT79726.1 Aste57867_2527 [Aphanomyces stellatus]